MKLNRDDIIKALECGARQNCDGCPLYDALGDSDGACLDIMPPNILSLIKELTQANEQLSESYDHLEKTKDELLSERSRLTEENEKLRAENAEQDKAIINALERMGEVRRETKSDTVREMQEALEHRIHSKLSYHGWYIKETVIPEIAKEMLGGKNDL